MAHIETPRFPDNISEGAVGGPTYNTSIAMTQDGREARNQNWDGSKLSYDVAFGVKTQDQLKELIAFFRSVKGKMHSFRFKDWTDYTATSSEGLLGETNQSGAFFLSGVGGTGPTYQLGKRYVTGAISEDRKIQKIVAGSYVIYKNAGAQTEGVDYTIDINTGIVTFAIDPGGGDALTASFQFDVPVRFDTDEMKVTLEHYNRYVWGQIPLIEVRV